MKNINNLNLYTQNYQEVTYRIGITEDELNDIKSAIFFYIEDLKEDAKNFEWMNKPADQIKIKRLQKLLEDISSIPF